MVEPSENMAARRRAAKRESGKSFLATSFSALSFSLGPSPPLSLLAAAASVSLSGILFLCATAWGGISEDRAKFVQAETLEETGFEAKYLNWYFQKMMQGIVREDPDLAAAIVLQTDRFIREDIAKTDESVFKPVEDGHTHIQEFLRRFDDESESIESIGVMVRTYRSDSAGRIPFSGSGRYSTQFALFSKFLSLGGNYDTGLAMNRLIPELRAVSGEGRAEFLAPYFLDLCHVLRPAQRIQLANWAIKKANEADMTIASLGEAIHLGLAFFERAEGTPVEAPGFLRGPNLDAKLLELLRDNTVSPAWRAGLAALIGRQFREEVSSEVRIECGRVLTRVLRDKIPFGGSSFGYAAATFLRGNEADSDWKSVASELLSAWEERTAKSASSDQNALRPGKHWLIPIMELACRTGKPEQIREHYQRYRNEGLVYPGFWIHLLEGRQYRLASELFAKMAPITAYRSDHYSLDSNYDQSLAEAVPPYLKTISDAKDRAFAELLLCAVVDPKVPKIDSSSLTLQERLANFALRHKEMPAWKKNHLIPAFEVLSLSHRNPKITKWLAENQTGLEKRLEQDSPEIRPYWATRMEVHEAIEELENGSAFPVQMAWGRAVFEENRLLKRHQNDLAEAIIDMIDGRIRAGCESKDAERLRKMLPACRQILETVPETVYRPDVHRFAVRVLAAHAFCDEMGAWNQWWANLKPVQQRHLVSLLQQSRNLVNFIERLFNPFDQPPGEVFPEGVNRRRVYQQILECEWVDRSYAGFSPLATMSARRLITERDLYDIAQPVAEFAPRKGSAWREYLGTLADQGHLDVALRTVYQKLTLLEGEDEDTASLALALTVEKMLIQNVTGRIDEAQKIEEELSARDDLSALPLEYKAIVRRLQKR